ncbi:MAG: UDP-N-acetylmuramate dehydrogenase [Dermatophilus congolensis]|nr:UDP-N-acetylmuramate dehydrogenase [Dermatophilus congolensis]
MKVEHGVPLAQMTTMRVGGPASRLVTVETADELVDAVREVDDADERLVLLGGGSNLLVGDAPVEDTVVRVLTRGVTVEDSTPCGGAIVRVAAGEPWDEFVARAVEEEWSGVECLSGIPGLVGATPVQNVGAYGQEVAQTIARVRTWDRVAGAVRTFTASECDFGYRQSLFKAALDGASPRYVVLDVTFQFELGDLSKPIAYADLARGLGVEQGARVPLADTREAVLEQRRRRGMVLDPDDNDTWSCGSFFMNPVVPQEDFDVLQARVRERLGDDVTPPQFPAPGGYVKTSAAWLIDRAGFEKGYGAPGPASLSTKHTLAVTNRGSATAGDVLALARRVRDGVDEAFGIRLVNEPVLLGESL